MNIEPWCWLKITSIFTQASEVMHSFSQFKKQRVACPMVRHWMNILSRLFLKFLKCNFFPGAETPRTSHEGILRVSQIKCLIAERNYKYNYKWKCNYNYKYKRKYKYKHKYVVTKDIGRERCYRKPDMWAANADRATGSRPLVGAIILCNDPNIYLINWWWWWSMYCSNDDGDPFFDHQVIWSYRENYFLGRTWKWALVGAIILCNDPNIYLIK